MLVRNAIAAAPQGTWQNSLMSSAWSIPICLMEIRMKKKPMSITRKAVKKKKSKKTTNVEKHVVVCGTVERVCCLDKLWTKWVAGVGVDDLAWCDVVALGLEERV